MNFLNKAFTDALETFLLLSAVTSLRTRLLLTNFRLHGAQLSGNFRARWHPSTRQCSRHNASEGDDYGACRSISSGSSSSRRFDRRESFFGESKVLISTREHDNARYECFRSRGAVVTRHRYSYPAVAKLSAVLLPDVLLWRLPSHGDLSQDITRKPDAAWHYYRLGRV